MFSSCGFVDRFLLSRKTRTIHEVKIPVYRGWMVVEGMLPNETKRSERTSPLTAMFHQSTQGSRSFLILPELQLAAQVAAIHVTVSTVFDVLKRFRQDKPLKRFLFHISANDPRLKPGQNEKLIGPPKELPLRLVVSLSQPTDQLFIHFGFLCDPDAMTDHCIETS